MLLGTCGSDLSAGLFVHHKGVTIIENVRVMTGQKLRFISTISSRYDPLRVEDAGLTHLEVRALRGDHELT